MASYNIGHIAGPFGGWIPKTIGGAYQGLGGLAPKIFKEKRSSAFKTT
jgi:hypothetical protein